MPDAGYPNYLTTAADGSVQAQFPGGVAMLAASSINANNPAADRSVSWHKDTVTGAMVANSQGAISASGLTAELQHTARTVPGNALSAVYQRAVDTDPAQTYVELSAIRGGSVGVARVVDANKKSDFAWRKETGTISVYNNLAADTGDVGFNLPYPATCLLVYGGTGYVGGAGLAYLNAFLDGGFLTAIPFYFNTAFEHNHLGPTFWGVNLGAGNHSMRLAAGGGLSRDSNDWNTMQVIYGPW